MRIRAVILLTTLTAPALAAAAYAGPSLHSEDVTKTVTGHITQLKVDADISRVTLTPGAASSVKAHLEWTVDRPDLSISSSHGVLTVRVRCNDKVSGGGVTVSLVATCVDDLRIVVPAGARLDVTSSAGDITARGFRGAADLRGGSVHVRDLQVPSLRVRGIYDATAEQVTSPSVQIAMSAGDISLDHVNGRVVSATSSSGAVRAADVAAGVLALTSSAGSVSVSRVSADTLSATTHNGTVDAADVRAARINVNSGSGDVQVQRATAQRLEAVSSNGRVGVLDSKVTSTNATSSSGDVDVQRLRGAALDARSSNGYVSTYDLHVQVLTAHSGSGDVVVQDLDAPTVVRATSSNGNVTVRVPAGRYYVDARSNNGTVHVGGLTLDRRAVREITAVSSSGDVSVTGV
ncbi:MAG: hypothetical protein QOE05_1748 [Actinomycetota bacterium]|jgi:DUF4097 and DUF4098 domain-containing protein YvlB|nr:hypothetical protein [Actinomycetota bacterium]